MNTLEFVFLFAAALCGPFLATWIMIINLHHALQVRYKAIDDALLLRQQSVDEALALRERSVDHALTLRQESVDQALRMRDQVIDVRLTEILHLVTGLHDVRLAAQQESP